MAALDACTAQPFYYRADITFSFDSGQRQFALNTHGVGPPVRGMANVQAHSDTVSGLQAGFETSVWVLSEAGGARNFELQLVTLSGAVANGATVAAAFNLDTILPTVGRAFDWTRDGFEAVMNSSFNAPTGANPLRLSWQVCPGQAAADCCSEVLAKVDQLLSYVSRIYSNPP